MSTQIRDRINEEITQLTRQAGQLDEQYRKAKFTTEERIQLLRRLLPHITPDLELVVEMLGITF